MLVSPPIKALVRNEGSFMVIYLTPLENIVVQKKLAKQNRLQNQRFMLQNSGTGKPYEANTIEPLLIHSNLQVTYARNEVKLSL